MRATSWRATLTERQQAMHVLHQDGMYVLSRPCCCTKYEKKLPTRYDDLHEKMMSFINETGLSMVEVDGPYGGSKCASTTHAHHHGEEDSVYMQVGSLHVASQCD